MTAVGEVLYLPVPSRNRLPFQALRRQQQNIPRQQQSHQHRTYRLDPNDQRKIDDTQQIAYIYNSFGAIEKMKGQNIDIYA